VEIPIIHTGMEKMKLSLLAGDLIVYVKNPQGI
jgi:hypothetical protein